MTNKVWIEIEPGSKAEMEDRAKLLTNMLRRLGGNPQATFYVADDGGLRYGTPHSFRELADNGEWFNLDHFGRSDEL